MKRKIEGTIFLTILISCSTLHAKQNITAQQFINSINETPKFNEECTYSNHDITKSDMNLSLNINLLLGRFGGLSFNDFDMGECLSDKNVKNGILSTYFWQKNKKFNGQNLSLYVAYNAEKQKLLLVIIDENLNTYLLGDKDAELKNSIQSFLTNIQSSEKVNTDSVLVYSDFNKDKKNKSIYDIDLDAIRYPEWTYSCKRDRFDNSKSCYMSNKDVGILLLNGRYMVSVGRDHYPNSKASLKIDNNSTLTANKGMFISNANFIIDQMKKGEVVYTRYVEWPYQYKNSDNESKLHGFTKKFNEMLESYKQL
ncbi:hypothetical protein [Acinetobacter sp. Marseille-Q1623]|uniref:hypothetical protein n=1 Tax=Acinetobacter sp. Marseille-Q1623 TaxID=2697501 RepID=UPI00157AAB10|nr:hypothetical protein [Acinetobacter sp. Marseille-Q1623]